MEVVATKKCTKCREDKPLSEYWVQKLGKHGRTSICKPCAKKRNHAYRHGDIVGYREFEKPKSEYARHNPAVWKKNRLRSAFGIEIDYDAMLAAQDGKCAICRSDEPGRRAGQKKDFAVDHCHATGVVRGLLCGRCNMTIGQMEDSPALLRAAADYVERHAAKNN